MVSLEEELELSSIYAALLKTSRCLLQRLASGKNLTEERDELKRTVKDYDLEASGKNLTEERDDLKRAVKDYVSEQNSLTEERDNLKRINLDLEASGKILTEERDELKRAVKDYVSQQNSLTEEGDKLKRINRDMVATNKNLSKERDDLGRTLSAGALCRGSTDEMVSLEEEPELSMIYEKFEDVSARKAASCCSVEDFKVPAAAPGMKMNRLLVVSFGLLCILQAALNISLRLTLFSQPNSLTEERDEMKRINLDLEAGCNNLTEERDDLNRTLENYVSQQNSLTEERDEMKRSNLDLQAGYNNLTEERDDLKRTLENYVSQQNSLTEERDEMKRINLDLEAGCNSLTEERDELKRTVKDYVSEQNSLTEERDNLKRINLDMVATNKNLSEERDDLKKTALVHYLQQGWVYFSGSFYRISSTMKTWQDSRKDCQQRGADLMIINSQEEQDFTGQYKHVTWIGLTDRDTEGEWKWVDGTQLTTRFWHSGEPNSHQKINEDCVNINHFDNQNSWNDAPCENEYLWICEKKM
ncbi:hypothetical protein NQZ68_005881 [Dissostichus eleginoides]|nr:hypothetical protein NQZ68_005881 [Dissostichus eleginoides]